jgi:hypothetical protein
VSDARTLKDAELESLEIAQRVAREAGVRLNDDGTLAGLHVFDCDNGECRGCMKAEQFQAFEPVRFAAFQHDDACEPAPIAPTEAPAALEAWAEGSAPGELKEAPGLTADEKALNDAVEAHSEARGDLIAAAHALRDLFGSLPPIAAPGAETLLAFCVAVDRERAASVAADEALQAVDPMVRACTTTRQRTEGSTP